MWQQIQKNKRKTIFFVILMTILFMSFSGVIGLYFCGDILAGLLFGLIIWICYLLLIFYSGDKFILSSMHALKVHKKDIPLLYDVVEEMTIAAGLKKIPQIYLIDEAMPNAFATGRTPEKSSIAVTTGLLVKLNREELQGVVAHEIAHIVNRDTTLMLFLGTILGAIILIANALLRSRVNIRVNSRGNAAILIAILYILCLILAPICAQLIYFAVSRKREYLADACAAQFTRYPLGLANALRKISDCDEPMKSANDVTAAMFIVNPLKLNKWTRKLQDLTSTHPSTQERIKILSSMANVSVGDYEQAFKSVTHNKKSPVTSGMTLTTSALLAAAPIISTKIPAEDKPEIKIQKYRKTEDVLWKYNGYIFIDCECGTKLKVPPELKGETILCPHCKKAHLIN